MTKTPTKYDLMYAFDLFTDPQNFYTKYDQSWPRLISPILQFVSQFNANHTQQEKTAFNQLHINAVFRNILKAIIYGRPVYIVTFPFTPQIPPQANSYNQMLSTSKQQEINANHKQTQYLTANCKQMVVNRSKLQGDYKGSLP